MRECGNGEENCGNAGMLEFGNDFNIPLFQSSLRFEP
jgi:hypothetical protein